MKQVLQIAAFALAVAVVVSNPCATVCNGSCAIAKVQCDATIVLGPVCGIAFGVCSQGCAAVCGCVDGCEAQCKPAFDTCITEAGSNILLKAQCAIQRDVCTVQCQEGCALQTAVQTVQGALGGGAAK